MGLPEGWYQVAGDPAGTRRFWDGERFVGNAQSIQASSRPSGRVNAHGSVRWRMASWLTRALVLLVDVAAPVIVITGIATAMGATHPGADLDAWREATGIVTAIVAFWLINGVALIGFTGRSLGHVIVGTRVVSHRDRTRAPGLPAALVRMLVMGPALPFSVAMLFFGKRRLVHDLAAGTRVVYV